MKFPIPALEEESLIEIVAPAKAIEEKHVQFAKDQLEKNGFKVRLSENCLGQYNYFSGTITERKNDFQKALNDSEVKAILCARGGYGCVQLVDKIDWSGFQQNPKWLVGFSDVTVFHQKIQSIGLPSIHGTMPLDFESNSEEAINTLLSALKNEPKEIVAPTTEYNVHGEGTGVLIGGNLSILYSLLGTNIQPKYDGTILYIEDLAEHIYHIDRMFHAFDKSGILSRLKGVVIGGMTNIKDTQIPYGCSFQEVILSHLKMLGIPVCFNFPAGHIDDNRSLILGQNCYLSVTLSGSSLTTNID